MKLKKSILLSIALIITAASTATAQEKPPSKESTPAAVKDHADCFTRGIKIVDDLPKRPTKKTEQRLIDKVIHFVTHDFKSQQAAFLDFDRNHDCKLDKSEVSQMLSDSHVNGFVRLFATTRLIERYDVSKDNYVEWPEFHFAIDKAIKKQAERKAKQH
ncbi:EF-hand domain-containing protein [Mariniblastus sp.]|nr:EF-hand domain-containing protein [Mariniblastus sp.]